MIVGIERVNQWIVLRRAREGQIALIDAQFFSCGRPLGAHLVGTVEKLLVSSHIEPVKREGIERLFLTERGDVRLRALERLRARLLRSRHG